MANVSITEILGSDSISGSRITINSNLLILQNWINGFESVFGIDTSTGVLDLTGASTGRVSALVGRFNTVSTPSSGNALASINSSGEASFSSTQTQTLTVSGSSIFSGTSSFASNTTFASGVTSSFIGTASYSGRRVVSANSSEIHNNNWSSPAVAGSTSVGVGSQGLTSEFRSTANNIGGGGIVTAPNTPYVLTGLEDVIYANCGPTGFYMKVADNNGETASNLPAGFRVTIVNTSGNTTANGKFIATGVTGTTTTYYTGFNTLDNYGGWNKAWSGGNSGKIVFSDSELAYKAAITVQWEPRIAADQSTQKGSWVLINQAGLSSLT
jgi:hypothetical protein